MFDLAALHFEGRIVDGNRAAAILVHLQLDGGVKVGSVRFEIAVFQDDRGPERRAERSAVGFGPIVLERTIFEGGLRLGGEINGAAVITAPVVQKLAASE